jgi:hypothetical protein
VRPLQRPATIRTSDQGTSLRTDVRNARLKSAFSPKIVAFQPEGDVYRDRWIEFRYAGREAPADRFELALACRQAQLEAIAPDELWRRNKVNTARDQHGRRIPHPERLEVAKHALEIFIGSVQSDLEIDPHFRNKVFGRQ